MRTALRCLAAAAAAALAAAGVFEAVRLYRAGFETHAGLDAYERSLKPMDRAASDALRRGAVPRLERAAALDPLDPEPHYGLGRIAAREARHGDAATHLAASLRANPFDGRTHYYYGMALRELGRGEEAERTMETAAAFSRNNPEHLYWIGYWFWSAWSRLGRVDDLRRAFQYFRAAAEGDLAFLDRALRVLETFALRYDNLVQVIPDTPAAHHQAGHYLGHTRGFWGPALEELRKAGTALEDKPDFLLDRGLALLFTGGDPVPDFLRGIEIHPDRKTVIRRLGWFYRAARRERESLPFWARLEEAYPSLAAPALSRAEVEVEMARTALEPEMKALSAERAGALAKALSPAEKAEVEAACTRKAAGLWTRALRDTEARLRGKVEALGDPDLRRTLAEVLAHQSRFDEAESCLRIGAETGGSPALWTDLVELLMRREKAEDAWKAALEARRRFPEDAQFDGLVRRAQDRMLSGRK
ncbi:MAG: hypothetical protein MUC63_04565 [Planctomycetes bacterium]|jgi:tetratricopeptide (TPR) repeat protein|nr:hypothetical protein [Planctomycetota bacterium]